MAHRSNRISSQFSRFHQANVDIDMALEVATVAGRVAATSGGVKPQQLVG
jgi:hypothetical protein